MDVIAPDGRVLVVADWSIDPYSVIAACRRRAADRQVTFGLVVPAWLHGLDWLGDPYASRPCAIRQLGTLARLASLAGLDVGLATTGDPDPGSAVDDALQVFPATEILLCRDSRRRRHPLDLALRLRRMTGLPVDAPPLRARPAAREQHGWRALTGGGHCVADGGSG